MAYNLTAAERETVIVWTDADDKVMINTSQAKQINALEKNPAFEETDRQVEGKRTVVLAGFLPLGSITVRNRARGSVKRAGVARKGMPSNAARCGVAKADGTPCKSLASKATGRCAKHTEVQ